ncbi:hypothetical protein PR048_010918 [Dryococelus australis]|uniref:Uncharacterized protein n=1 Tax=Dryococelus australis TaxID=614101 RepID=A0ABQ9I447_9NEOP|nr:hypothetical protein PR048_010918 [Dryococelus australis]
MSDYKAEKHFGIPRRTLRNYVKSVRVTKSKLGRRFALSEEQTTELCSRILHLAEVGYPFTPKVLRLFVCKYCETNKIEHQFFGIKQIARQFSRDNPTLSIRKAQNLNPARTQNLNKCVVEDSFIKIKSIYEDNNIFGKPERLFNRYEKGCRLNIHKPQKGAHRVHIIGNEHGENVTS